MRTLTAAEVEKEARDIVTRPWPMHTLLFMKNLYERHPPNIGVLIRKQAGIEPRVKVMREGEGVFIPYESIKALVEDGWVAD